MAICPFWPCSLKKKRKKEKDSDLNYWLFNYEGSKQTEKY